MSLFDNALGPQPTTLKIRSQRSVVLANNIANSETPNFKARDYDFKAVLNQTSDQLGLSKTRAGHIGGDGDAGGLNAELGYRVPTQAASDGNTVESHVEKAQFAENSSRYVADLTFLKSRVQGLIRAMGSE
ncbi:MAG: flagellar basal body rod protein FlgB [Gammaproteobacteria bacterium]|nr:flagellar basal body rod protein FlgB [Gammaproteobacteria bacterium]